jgi:hypothetical protein
VSLNLRTLLATETDALVTANLTMTRFLALEMKRRGVELRLVIEGDPSPASPPDPSLLKAIARGHRWFSELAAGKAASIKAIAEREGVYASYVKRLIPLAFLAPEIIHRICHGSQPTGLTAEALKRAAPLPMEWEHQRQVLRFG